MGVRLWCLGDLHLGRRPHRLADRLVDAPVDVADLTPAVGLGLAVDAAVAAEADAVLLAGDVVESMQDRYAALVPLEAACRRLADAGIPVLAVAGNHDLQALPALAARLPGALRLLGAGGDWEAADIDGTDGVSVRVVGRSFARPVERSSPLPALDGAALVASDRPTVGLLHCDLDQGASPHAPVSRGELNQGDAGRCAAWLLGHVHKPGHLEGARPVGYLGSVVALDAGEQGIHGPWQLDLDGAGGASIRQVPLSPVRYERLDVDCSGAAGDVAGWSSEQAQEALMDLLRQRMAELLRQCLEEHPGLRVLCVRAQLHGPVGGPTMRDAVRWLGAQLQHIRMVEGAAIAVCDGCLDQLELPIELGVLAQEAGPIGTLARLLQDLRENTPAGRRAAAEYLEGVFGPRLRHGPWAPQLHGIPPGETAGDAQEHLEAAVRDLLLELHGARQAVGRSGGGP